MAKSPRTPAVHDEPMAEAPGATIQFAVPCPDCDWCVGMVALLDLPGQDTVAVSYDPAHAVEGVRLLVVGRDLDQVGFGGLASRPGKVCVGPCHPAYVAINLAYQAGAPKVSLVGASPELRDKILAHLKPAKGVIDVAFV